MGFASAVSIVAAEDRAVGSQPPKPRPRITETLRVKADDIAREADTDRSIAMDKVVVRDSRLPSGPPKEQPREGRFAITDGGYVLKSRGDKFTTQIGLWRHVDIMEDKVEQLKQSERIKMDVLRISW